VVGETYRDGVRCFAATSAALGVVVLGAGCSDGSSSPSREGARCLYRSVFVAFQNVRGIQARCPTWLPVGVSPTYVHASAAPEYVVEFETPRRQRYRHVVLQLAQDDPPGDRVGDADVGNTRAAIYFEPSPSSGAAGLHSGHYIVDVLGGAYQRGSYWVSVHENPQQSRRWNVQRALKIARSLRPIPR
jgi:hypothetical protein